MANEFGEVQVEKTTVYLDKDGKETENDKKSFAKIVTHSDKDTGDRDYHYLLCRSKDLIDPRMYNDTRAFRTTTEWLRVHPRVYELYSHFLQTKRMRSLTDARRRRNG